MLQFLSFRLSSLRQSLLRKEFGIPPLELINTRSLLKETSTDNEWIEMVINQTDTVEPNILPMLSNYDLPTKEIVLVLYWG